MADQHLHRNWSKIYGTVGDHPWSGTDLVEKFETEIKKVNPEPKNVLDVGCGEGDKSRWFAERGFTVTAVDVSPAAIATARRLSTDLSIHYHELDIADLSTLAIPESSIGLVFDSGSSQFLPARKQAGYFRTISEVLSPQGCLLYQALASTGPSAPLWLQNLGITPTRFETLTKERFKPAISINRPSRNLADVTVFGGLFTHEP